MTRIYLFVLYQTALCVQSVNTLKTFVSVHVVFSVNDIESFLVALLKAVKQIHNSGMQSSYQ